MSVFIKIARYQQTIIVSSKLRSIHLQIDPEDSQRTNAELTNDPKYQQRIQDAIIQAQSGIDPRPKY